MARAQLDELVALADEKGTPYWRARGWFTEGFDTLDSKRQRRCSTS